jgi:hypothetical protein
LYIIHRYVLRSFLDFWMLSDEVCIRGCRFIYVRDGLI